MLLTLCQFIIYECNTNVSTIVGFFLSFSLVDSIVNVSVLICIFCGCNLNSVQRNWFGYCFVMFCNYFFNFAVFFNCIRYVRVKKLIKAIKFQKNIYPKNWSRTITIGAGMNMEVSLYLPNYGPVRLT